MITLAAAPDPDAQLVAEREHGLGGSDAGAVLGFSKWATPLDVYIEKTDWAEEIETGPARWGKLLEEPVAREWSRQTGIALRPSPTLWHPREDWMLGHLDRVGVTEPLVYEGKTTTGRLAHEWGPSGQTFDTAADAADQVPAVHVAQCAHYMAVADLPLAALAVLIDGQDFRLYWVRRDLGFETLLIEGLRAFWHDHVLARVPPEPTNALDVAKLHPRDDGSSVVADNDCIAALQAHHAAQAQFRAAENEKDRAKYRITRFMGDATTLTDADGARLATWRREGNRRSRTFRATQLKEIHDEQ